MSPDPEVPAPSKVVATSTADGLLIRWTPAHGTQAGTTYEIALEPPAARRTETGTGFLFRDLERGKVYQASVVAVHGDRQSAAVTSAEVMLEPERSRRWSPRTFSLALCGFAFAGALTFALLCLLPTSNRAIFASLAMACAVTGVALTIMTLMGRRPNGLLQVLIGADGRVSTSYLQIALWTALVGFVLVYFTGLTWFADRGGLFEAVALGSTLPGSPPPLEVSPAWDDYLILLGGPFAALVTARGIVGAKVANKTVQKTMTDDGSASLLQALKDDGGRPSLVDNQYLVFNLAAFVYVIVGIASLNRLPTIPPLLLALTSSAAAGYVLGKAVDANPPSVGGLTPSTARIGERIAVRGQNLMPGDSGPPSVSIGGRPADVDPGATTSQVIVAVPVGLAPGPQELLVTTGANVTTEGRYVQILEDKPVVLGVEPITPKALREFTIYTLGAIPAGDPSSPVSVLFDGVPSQATATRSGSSSETITVTAPASPSGDGRVSVVVRTVRLAATEPITLSLEP